MVGHLLCRYLLVLGRGQVTWVQFPLFLFFGRRFSIALYVSKIPNTKPRYTGYCVAVAWLVAGYLIEHQIEQRRDIIQVASDLVISLLLLESRHDYNMAGLQQSGWHRLLPAPDLGPLYMLFGVLKDSIEDWAVQDKLDCTATPCRVIYKSKDDACDWPFGANEQAPMIALILSH